MFLALSRYTIPLKSTATQPPIAEDGEVPDDVASWFVKNMAKYIAAVDRVITPTTLQG